MKNCKPTFAIPCISSMTVWLNVHHTYFPFCLRYISQPPLQLGMARCLNSRQQYVGGSDVHHFQ